MQGVTATGPSSADHRLTVLLGDVRDAAEAWHRTACGLLDARGVSTVTVANGREAVDMLAAGATGRGPRVHVAVLEQTMPDMTGLQAVRRLRDELRDAAGDDAVPPTILLAEPNARGGGMSGPLLQAALASRVFSVLPRPPQPDLLLDTLARALQRFYAGRWPGASN
jgi:CheY-like chemotaxis protein